MDETGSNSAMFSEMLRMLLKLLNEVSSNISRFDLDSYPGESSFQYTSNDHFFN